MTLHAITRPVSPSLANCELTHLSREPIDIARAIEQHATYEALLRSLGADVYQAPGAPENPDAVFIEDTAVVLDEVAILARPGAVSRRGEVAGVAQVLSEFRSVATIDAPGTMDGGDVLVLGSRIFVGCGYRTNITAIEQLGRIVAPFGYDVVPVDFEGCLHLKTAATAIDDHTVLLNSQWVSPDVFAGKDIIHIDGEEAFAANVLRVGKSLVSRILAQYLIDREELLQQRGFAVNSVDCTELAKAEGAVTCCSLVFER